MFPSKINPSNAAIANFVGASGAAGNQGGQSRLTYGGVDIAIANGGAGGGPGTTTGNLDGAGGGGGTASGNVAGISTFTGPTGGAGNNTYSFGGGPGKAGNLTTGNNISDANITGIFPANTILGSGGGAGPSGGGAGAGGGGRGGSANISPASATGAGAGGGGALAGQAAGNGADGRVILYIK